MSQALRKTNEYSVVRGVSQPESMPVGSAASLEEFFGGWLDSVAPRISQQQAPATPRFRLRKLPISTTDIVRVNRATVRESTAHRHWPPDVVAQFLTAEVITRKNKRR